MKINPTSIYSLLFIILIFAILPNSYGITAESGTIQTWIPWKLSDTRALTISIENSNLIPPEKIDAIKEAILSGDIIKIEDPQTLGEVDSIHPYFKGWKGALESTSVSKFHIPTKFIFIESSKDADITIQLTNSPNDNMYSAYTKPILKGEYLIKTQIIIYRVSEYSADRLGGIVRHEFGHALGLGHSTDPEDLMYYLLNTDYPYISACDVNVIHSLYDGKESSNVKCEK